MKNICLIGHGMMGIWHAEALRGHPGARLHSVVGRDLPQVRGFADQYGFAKASVNMVEAVNDPEVDAVIIAGPSESHAAMAMEVIRAGKPVLVEIPIGMTLEAAEAVVRAAEAAGVMLAVSHPMRFRPERREMLARIRAGEETPRHVHGRFFIHRLVNIGATGIKRNWIDNILWHHSTHLLDLGLWLVGKGDPEAGEARVRRVQSFMSGIDPHTGTPMEVAVLIETHDEQSILATGSYYARERIYDTFVVTDRDSYRLDELSATLTTGAGTGPALSEHENAWAIARDFVAALNEARAPLVTGRSVLPVMRVLERVQREWDARHGEQSIPGRPLDQFNVAVV
ncbi:Gfo/Idh/MocA family protein [Acidocella sp.]|uniref:Gfo/Idh/MocA family protein n=1 Tax=Acidocella sp. TaxID=50710 RepID=UPI0026108A76|nr:Gfo/Idh/MocA family oxidoreductase [Acidocella sp.]